MESPLEKQNNISFHLAFVLGQPIHHSLSPFLFRAFKQWLWLRKDFPQSPHALEDFHYFPLSVGEGELRKTLEDFKQLHSAVVGFNVTYPLKEIIIPHLDQLSELAKKMGAVNVVKVNHQDQGKFVGYNTDLEGLEMAIGEYRIPVQGKEVLILGAGGAAKACLFVLQKLQAKRIYIVSRNLDKTKKLVEGFSNVESWPLQAGKKVILPRDVSFIINATPMGLAGGPLFDWKIKSAQNSSGTLWAMDLIYRPYPLTPFMQMCLDQKLSTPSTTVNGLSMLIWQALATQKIFFPKIAQSLQEEDWLHFKQASTKLLRII